MSRRVFGYARVSSEEQARGTSLEDQQNAIRAYAKSRGLNVDRFYVEAESAVHEKIELREKMLALMAEIRSGDLVLCDKLDRWSRDPEFTWGSVRKILERNASVYFVSESCDPSTSEGDTTLHVRVLVAREEHKRIKERMVGTRRKLRDRGYYADGHPPVGYKRPHPRGYKGAEKNILAIVPDGAELVRRVFAMCIGGSPLTAIARELDRLRDFVSDTLKNRTYLGEVRSSTGAWIRGLHEPIIDAETFELAQAALASRRLTGARMKPEEAQTSGWLLRDVARCAKCGSRMASAWAGPKDARRYYYRCGKKCTTTFVRVDAVEPIVAEMIIDRLDELRVELARGELEPAKHVDTSDRRAKLDAKRARFLEAFAEGFMTRAELGASMGRIDAERTRLDALDGARKADTKARADVLYKLKAIHKSWDGLTPPARRQIAGMLLLGVAIAHGEAPVPTWRELRALIVNATRVA